LGVPATYTVWTAGQQVGIQPLLAAVPADQWICLSAGTGSQGARLYDWTWLELPITSTPRISQWVLARRNVTDPTEMAYYHVYAASTTPLTEVVPVVGTRWVIESGFAQAKGEVGLDQYQVRSWPGWYRAITLALVGYGYLAILRAMAPPPPAEHVAVSIPEIRRWLVGRPGPGGAGGVRAGWSAWRRRHQATARRCHEQRRRRSVPQPTAPIPAACRLPGLGPLTEERWGQIAAVLPARPKAGQRGKRAGYWRRFCG
jgi:hypothetical protein